MTASVPPVRTVLLAAPFYPPDGGGLELYVQALARGLHRTHGLRVVVVASNGRRERDDVTVEDGVEVYRLRGDVVWSKTPLGIRWAARLGELIADCAPDVVNVHGPVPGMADLAARAAGDVPVAVTWHAGSMVKPRSWANPAIRAYERLLLPRLLDRADQVIATSEHARGVVDASGDRGCVVISPGVDTDRFVPGPSPAEPTILFVAGHIGPAYAHKGLELLLDAYRTVLAEVPDARMTIVGKVDSQSLAMQWIRARGIPPSAVSLPGKLAGDELVAAYQSARVLVHPALAESFGMVLIEAMACCRPVVASAVGDIPVIVADGVSGRLVAPGRPDQIARAVVPLLTDPSAADAMGARGREHVRRRYAWSSVVQGTFDQFSNLWGETHDQVAVQGSGAGRG